MRVTLESGIECDTGERYDTVVAPARDGTQPGQELHRPVSEFSRVKDDKANDKRQPETANGNAQDGLPNEPGVNKRGGGEKEISIPDNSEIMPVRSHDSVRLWR